MATKPDASQLDSDIDVPGHLTTVLFGAIVVLMVLLIMAVAMAA